jgi:two-component system response regulator NreC
MSQARTRVLVIEDHTIVRQGLIALLSATPTLEVVGEAGDGLTALELLTTLAPEVALCDLGLPGLGGLEVMEQARERGCEAKFVVLSMYHDAVWVQRAVAAGARGYLLKGAGLQDLTQTIERVARGEVCLSYGAQVAQEQRDLSTREREVLTFVAQGHTSREISALLDISARTVEHHRARVMEKLGIYDVAGLTRYAVRVGLIDPNLK